MGHASDFSQFDFFLLLLYVSAPFILVGGLVIAFIVSLRAGPAKREAARPIVPAEAKPSTPPTHACPNCEGPLYQDSANCRQCGALFGGASHWSPKPLGMTASQPK